jgi:hypothetical protein
MWYQPNIKYISKNSRKDSNIMTVLDGVWEKDAGDFSPARVLGVSPNSYIPQRMGDTGGSVIVSPF